MSANARGLPAGDVGSKREAGAGRGDTNNSPRGSVELVAVPIYGGGRLDPIGGQGKRIADLKKIEVVEGAMREPAMLTLTIDRRRFDGPESAHVYASALVSRLLTERLGAKLWARVMEPQTKSGDGWVHWHCLVDLAEIGSLRRARLLAWRFWRNVWGVGGCDLFKVTKSATGYLAPYVTKAWPAVPPWMGESRKRFRLVGFSLDANELIRSTLGLPRRPSRKKKSEKQYRPTAPLFHRLAMSGLRTAIIAKYSGGSTCCVGVIAGTINALCVIAPMVPGMSVATETVELKRSKVQRLRLGFRTVESLEAGRRFVTDLRRHLAVKRVFRDAQQRYERDLDAWRHSWDCLQVSDVEQVQVPQQLG